MLRRRRALAVWLALVIVASGCEGKATVAYQSPAASAASASWAFDGDATGGVPPGAEVFSGSWVVRAEADTPSKPNALCQVGSAEFPAVALGTIQS